MPAFFETSREESQCRTGFGAVLGERGDWGRNLSAEREKLFAEFGRNERKQVNLLHNYVKMFNILKNAWLRPPPAYSIIDHHGAVRQKAKKSGIFKSTVHTVTAKWQCRPPGNKIRNYGRIQANFVTVFLYSTCVYYKILL